MLDCRRPLARFGSRGGRALADVFDHTDLHRHEFKLLADFFAEGVLAADTDKTG